MTGRRGRQSAEVAEQTRQSLLEAAGRQFAARGFRATSLRDIAADAGTTHGMIRHHFGTKDDLWRAVVEDFVQRVATQQLPLVAQGLEQAEPIAQLRAIATVLLREAAERPEIARLIVMDCAEPGPRLDFLVEQIRPVHLAIVPLFERARAAGHVQGHDAGAFFLSLMFLGSVPFALADFAGHFYRQDLRTEAGREAHIERVLLTLFGPSGLSS